MLTVKHISETSGSEMIYAVDRVQAITVGDTSQKPGKQYHHVVLIFADGHDFDLSENGEVYVMNDQGKTIAKYYLPYPHSGIGLKTQSLGQH